MTQQQWVGKWEIDRFLLYRNYDFKPTAHLPNRCSQCAARFPAGQTGKDRLQAHLDWHFRRNRKEKENEGRGANRRWLPRAEFWIKDVTSNAVSADGAGASGSSSSKPGLGMAPKVDAAYVAKQREDLQNSWIPVPSDPAKAALPCPICKEKFVSEYNEDEEEWIWMNAIEADGQVSVVRPFSDSGKIRCGGVIGSHQSISVLRRNVVHLQISHATCRSDAVATAVANRLVTDNKSSLRAESPARSRANTPQAAISVSSVKSPPRNVKENTPTQNANPAKSAIPSSLEADVKPTTAILQAADRLNTSVRKLRENSTDSSSSAGVKRKAHEDVDLLKEIKKEKA
jgi:pre-mRNA cleavage complex 2 protein Pcf11